MTLRRAIFIGLLVATAAWPAGLRAADLTAGPPAAGGPPMSVVVLQNGSVVQGGVEETADRLIVSNGPGYVVRVPVTDVDFVAPDWSTAYRTLRARLERSDFRRHAQLAQWCLRHDLEQFAADQLLHLVRLDPHHASVRALEQELRRRAGRPNNETERMVAATSAADAAARAATAPRDGQPTDEDLPPVPADALAEFTRSIQPLLLNRCGQTTCHGRAGANAFHLQRLTASGDLRRTLTLRNLRSAMDQLDPTGSDHSPLLEHGVRPHGGSQLAPLGPQDTRQYGRLRDWVHWIVTGQRIESAAADDEDPSAAPVAPAVSAVFPRATTPNGSLPPAAAPLDGPVQNKAVDRVELPAAAGSDERAEVSPVDPYNPAEFNARFSDADPPAGGEKR